MGLSATKTRNLKPAKKDQWLNDGQGLYLRVYHTGKMVWVNHQRFNGKAKITKLGEAEKVKKELERHAKYIKPDGAWYLHTEIFKAKLAGNAELPANLEAEHEVAMAKGAVGEGYMT